MNEHQIRSRGNATIKEIKISKENRKYLSKAISHDYKEATKDKIKQVTGGSPCCICAGIPDYEVRYNVGDERQSATRIERYCKDCIKIYEREQVL